MTHYNLTNYNFQIKVFTGKYPPKPKFHTCEHTTIASVKPEDISVKHYTQRLWRKRNDFQEVCPVCFYDHVIRICKQIETEINFDPCGDWGYILIDQKDFQKFINRYNAKRNYYSKKIGTNKDLELFVPNYLEFNLKYVAIPQTNKSLMVFHNSIELSDSTSIPNDLLKLYSLVKQAVIGMEGDSRLRRSQGFGREFAGSKGYTAGTSPDLSIDIVVKDRLKLNEILKSKPNLFELIKKLESENIDYWVVKKDREKFKKVMNQM